MAKPTCSVDDCMKPVQVKKTGYCSMHQGRHYRWGTTDDKPAATKPTCVVGDCPRKVVSTIPGQGRVCGLHRRRWLDYGQWDLPKRKGPACREVGCTSEAEHGRLCGEHFAHPSTVKGAAGMRWIAALPVGATECITWPGKRSEKGYGLYRNGEMGERRAHRIVCRVFHGDPPDDLPFALHSCGKGHEGCVNPSHIYWGTAAQNSRDRDAHGNTPLGSQTHCAILTEAVINPIRRDARPVRDVAEHYGVSEGAIRDVQSGRNWKHVPWE